MRSKPAQSPPGVGFLDWLIERGEETVEQLGGELFGRKDVAQRLGRGAGRAADARRVVDRNMQALLSLLNLPSRADYNKLLARVDALQGSLVNVSMKLDRLLAAQSGKGPAPTVQRPPRKTTRPRKPSNRPAGKKARGKVA